MPFDPPPNPLYRCPECGSVLVADDEAEAEPEAEER